MARIDSLLSLIGSQGADELRLGTDREPQSFASGAQKRLVMPKTSTETLRELLGELLSPEREKLLAIQGQVQFLYEAGALGPFRVALTRRSAASAPLELDAIFQRGRGKVAPAALQAPALEAPHAPHVHAGPTSPTTEAHPPARHEASSVETVAMPRIDARTDARIDPAARSAPRSFDVVTPELAALLARTSAMRASDVHLADGELPLARVDGALRTMQDEPPTDLGRLFDPAIIDEVRRRSFGAASIDGAFTVPSVGRFRLNLYQTAAGVAAAVRALAAAPPQLGEIGLPIPLDDVIDLPHGLVIVCGATGSGKSTTLAALGLEVLRRHPRLLITLEDPIEYVLPTRGQRGVARQRQVGRDVRDFATGLRDALREDPDVLVVGEMRDPETISLALTAAETGHLVLTSLHSRSAASAVERIVDSYPPERQHQIRVQLADALRVIVAQRLVPRASGEGRALAVEVLRGTYAVANAIREAKTGGIQSAIQAGRREGMIPLERCLAELVQRHRITVEAARAAANDVHALASYLTPAGSSA